MAEPDQKPVFVSVVVPTFNRERTIVRCVENILEQDYQHFEVLVVDDGSTDRTAEVLAPYADKIRLIKKENGGVGSARNLGAKEAKGEWLAYQDSDDLWDSDKLSYQVGLVEKYGDVNAVVCNLMIYREHFGREVNWFDEIGISGSREAVAEDPFLLHLDKRLGWLQSMLIRKRTALACGLSDENLKIFVDLDFLLKLARFGKWTYSDRIVGKICRDFEDNESISSRRKKDPRIGFEAMEKILSLQLDAGGTECQKAHLRSLLSSNRNKAGNYANYRREFRLAFRCYMKAYSIKRRPILLVKALFCWIPFARSGG